jgi:hypothetical protein
MVPALDLATPYGLPAVRAVVMQASDGTISIRIETSSMTTTLLLTAESACDLAAELGDVAGMCKAGGHVAGSNAEYEPPDSISGEMHGRNFVHRYPGRWVGCPECVHWQNDRATEAA